jgi:hypothetical protein
VASPWVVKDPLRAAEPFAERRARLAKAGEALVSGSGAACPDPAVAGPCENGHVEGVYRRDVQVGVKPLFKRYRGRVKTTRLSRARPLTSSRSAQRNVALAASGRRLAAAWEERRGAHDRVFMARSGDRGRHWSRPVGMKGSGDQRWPAVAISRTGLVTVAWNDGRPRALFARVRGRRAGAARAIDATAPVGTAQWKPALATGPGGSVLAAWVDERERSADDDLPQAHVYWARRLGKPGKRLDQGAPAELAARFDNSWAPRIASRGKRVLVTWVDFQGYDWGVFSRLSRNGGATFGRQVRVTSDPAVLGSGGRPLIAWTDWRKRDSAATKPHQEYDTFIASPGGRNRQIDPYGGRQVSTFWPSACPIGRRDALVAFQDSSAGRSVVRVVGTRRRRARLVSDAGARGGNSWRPRIACSGGRVLAVWEDERDGPPRLYFSTGAARTLW